MAAQSQGTPVPTIFTFESHEVRSLLIGDQPWFVAADVARALNYRDAEVASRHLDDDEKRVHPIGVPASKGVVSNDALCTQRVTVINESGLYALVLRSRKPEARKFAKWVTSEVLPEIRKTGSYRAVPPGDILDPIVNGKPLSKSAQVRMIGNSVCPPLAAALVRANFTHEQVMERAA